MIYCCDICHFTFERAGSVEACPACDNPAVREATHDEQNEYRKNRSMRDKNNELAEQI